MGINHRELPLPLHRSVPAYDADTALGSCSTDQRRRVPGRGEGHEGRRPRGAAVDSCGRRLLRPAVSRGDELRKEYRVIDRLLEGTTRPTSPFTAKTGASMLDTLFERALHIPLWILSLGNEVVTIEELEAKMVKLGRQTKAI